MESKIVFGQMLDYYRKENNLTMEELGKILGKTKATISRWISGERSPKMMEVEAIAEYFGTDVETLVFGNAEKHIVAKIAEDTMKLTTDRQEKVYDFVKFQLNEQERES